MPKNIMEISQYGVGRIYRNNTSVHGLCTTNLNNCLGIILLSKNKLLLTHIDTNIDTDSLAAQMRWMDEGYSVIIVKNKQKIQEAGSIMQMKEYSAEGFIERLHSSVVKLGIPKWSNLKWYNTSTGIATVFLDGNIQSSHVNTEKPHHFQARQAINLLNYLSKCDDSPSLYAQLDLDLQYDNNYWTPMPYLTQIAHQLVSNYRTCENWPQFMTSLKNSKNIYVGLIDILQFQQADYQNQMRFIIDYQDIILTSAVEAMEKVTIKEKSSQGLKKGFFNYHSSKIIIKNKYDISPLDDDGEPTAKFEFFTAKK